MTTGPEGGGGIGPGPRGEGGASAAALPGVGLLAVGGAEACRWQPVTSTQASKAPISAGKSPVLIMRGRNTGQTNSKPRPQHVIKIEDEIRARDCKRVREKRPRSP